eukprot:scaffold20364_cov112-Isochrysis_galbana.AAC.2
MQASLRDAVLEVPDGLRPIIKANVDSFNELLDTGDESNAKEMIRLINETRARLQEHEGGNLRLNLSGKYRTPFVNHVT